MSETKSIESETPAAVAGAAPGSAKYARMVEVVEYDLYAVNAAGTFLPGSVIKKSRDKRTVEQWAKTNGYAIISPNGRDQRPGPQGA